MTNRRKWSRWAAIAVGISCLLQLAAAAAATLRVAVISDLNGSYGSIRYEPGVTKTIERIVELHPDLVISTGDMVAGQRPHPPFGREKIEAMWTAFHGVVSDPLRDAGVPLAVTPGNHDASAYASFSLEREIFRTQWAERTQGLEFVDRADYPFRYAFAAGDVLFVSLDATRVGELDEAQRRWLDALLTREGGRFRHRVVFSHLPVYPFTQGRETEVTADHELEHLLKRHGVELYLSGHHHAFYPGFHDGLRHVGQACLGAGPRRLIGSGAVAARAVTWLEFGDQGIRITGLVSPALEQAVDLARLPASIHSRYGTLVRDDLRPGAVPAAAR